MEVFEDSVVNACLPPPRELVVYGLQRTEPLGQITPSRAAGRIL